jgi:hypothetical protein
MNEVVTTNDPATLEHLVRSAKRMYPQAEVKVRRGRVIAVEDDLIRFIYYRGGANNK